MFFIPFETSNVDQFLFQKLHDLAIDPLSSTDPFHLRNMTGDRGWNEMKWDEMKWKEMKWKEKEKESKSSKQPAASQPASNTFTNTKSSP